MQGFRMAHQGYATRSWSNSSSPKLLEKVPQPFKVQARRQQPPQRSGRVNNPLQGSRTLPKGCPRTRNSRVVTSVLLLRYLASCRFCWEGEGGRRHGQESCTSPSRPPCFGSSAVAFSAGLGSGQGPKAPSNSPSCPFWAPGCASSGACAKEQGISRLKAQHRAARTTPGSRLWAHHSTSAASAGPSLADFGKESLSLSFWRLCDFSLVDESRKRCMLSRACNSREGLTRYSRHKLDMTSTLL